MAKRERKALEIKLVSYARPKKSEIINRVEVLENEKIVHRIGSPPSMREGGDSFAF